MTLKVGLDAPFFLKVLFFLGGVVAVRSYGILRHDRQYEEVESARPPSNPAPEGEHPHSLSDASVSLNGRPTSGGFPENFSWRHVPGVGSLLTPSQNQHIPQYCGACFAFGSFHTLQDRIKIARDLVYNPRNLEQGAVFNGQSSAARLAASPDFTAAIQVMLNCGKDTAGTCNAGGDVPGVYTWVKEFGGIPVESCMPYAATDDFQCSPENVCRNCMGANDWSPTNAVYECWGVDPDSPMSVPCFGSTCVVQPYPRFGVEDFGKVEALDPSAMQEEIARAGPIACYMDALPLLGYLPFDPETGKPNVISGAPNGRTSQDTDHVGAQ